MKQAELPPALVALRRLEFPRKLGICDRLFGRQLEKLGVCWVETSAGIAWKLDLANPTHRWIVYGEYEGRGFLGWSRKYLRPDATVVDSGANIGQMLLFLSASVPRGRILAFEPGAFAADWLEECLDVHPTLPVTLVRKGLGAGSASAFLAMRGPANSQGSWNQVSDKEGDPIEIVTLDEVAGQYGLDVVDLWKLDVEGYEIAALEGAAELLRSRRIGALYVELAFGNGGKIVEFLSERGYRGFVFDRGGRLKPLVRAPEHGNGLFLPVDPSAFRRPSSGTRSD